MIRASNQLSPKTKVVDLLFLYNFYFGQISCSHRKFGVSACQFQVKIIQTMKQCLHCARHCDAPTPYRRLWPAASFHASAIAFERRSSPRGRPRSLWCRPNPPFSSSVHDEPSSSEQNRAKSPPSAASATARRPASIRRTPSCTASPSNHSDHPQARPCPTPAEIELRPPSAIAIFVKLRPELRPSRQRPPSGHPPP